MNNKIIKFFKNKNIWIIGIVIFLMLMYIVVQINVNKKDNNVEEWDEMQVEETNENQEKSDGNFEQENKGKAQEDSEETQENNEEVQENNEEMQENDGEQQENNTETQEKGGELKKKTEETLEKIYVYITGEVINPGVVILNYGSRIADAIEAAGGVTDGANITKVNLVYILQDGMKVNIPSNKDLRENENFEYITMSSGDEKNDANLNTKSSTDINSSINSNQSSETAFKIDVVNINTATQTELETLPGIGPSLALKIINYRKENGKFSSIEDIKNVSGIGDSKYESIKDYIKI